GVVHEERGARRIAQDRAPGAREGAREHGRATRDVEETHRAEVRRVREDLDARAAARCRARAETVRAARDERASHQRGDTKARGFAGDHQNARGHRAQPSPDETRRESAIAIVGSAMEIPAGTIGKWFSTCKPYTLSALRRGRGAASPPHARERSLFASPNP